MNLEGRKARCTCKNADKIVPSSTDLAFFEYRGPESKEATVYCKHCNYHLDAHTKKIQQPEKSRHLKSVCDSFENDPDGKPFDLYYCGHGGWD